MVSALFAWHATRTHPEPSLRQPLAELLPTGEEWGWTYEDLPLGATESLQQRSESVLKMTDYVYRRYSNGVNEFEIYLAYWEPGAQTVREVSVHVPDTCWRSAGWEITERNDNFLISDDLYGSVDQEASSIPEGRWRIFQKRGYEIEVVFWHVLNGAVYRVGADSFWVRGKHFLFAPFEPESREGGEQWLVRLSSVNGVGIHDLEKVILSSIFEVVLM